MNFGTKFKIKIQIEYDHLLQVVLDAMGSI